MRKFLVPILLLAMAAGRLFGAAQNVTIDPVTSDLNTSNHPLISIPSGGTLISRVGCTVDLRLGTVLLPGSGGGGTPGGSNTQIQFNDSGSFNGDSGLTWNKTTKLLTVTAGLSRTPFSNSIVQLLGTAGSPGILSIDTEGAAGEVILRQTAPSITAIGINTNLGFLGMAGYDGASYTSGRVRFQATSSENWTIGANGTVADIYTTANGTSSPLVSLEVSTTATTALGTLSTGSAGGVNGAIIMNGKTSGAVTMKVHDIAGTWNAIWPTTPGTNGYSLTTDGTGTLAWSNVSGGGGGGTPGGSDTNVQYNNAGTFAGSASFTWAQASKLLTVSYGTITRTPFGNSVIQVLGNSGSAAVLSVDAEDAAGELILRRANSGPAAIANGDLIGFVGYAGYDGTTFPNASARVQATSSQNWAVGAHGTVLDFFVTANGSSSVTQMMELASTGLAVTTGVNTPALTNLTTNGFVKTSGGTGTLSVDTSTYLTANQSITLSGDVTGSGTTAITTTLANVPSGTPHAGSILFSAIAAPGTPASGKASVYVDSTSKNLAVKNDAGTVNHGIQTRTATGSNWIRSIADDGSTTISQPAFSDISGTLAGSNVTGAYTSAGMTMSTARLLGRTTASTGAVEEITVGSGLTLSAGTLTASGGGSGTVTNTGGALIANAVVLGAGGNDTKVVSGIITDGVSVITLGVNTTTIGKVKMFGNTSGDATIQPAAVAGTATVVTLPNASSTLPIFSQQITFTGPTAARTVTFVDANFTAARIDAAQTFTGASTTTSWNENTPVITGGLTASGSGANTFVGSTGTFITSTGANTLSGAVTINDATTPSLTTASGKTNTGFVTISGKTSGTFKLTTADATAQAVTVSAAAQTTGATTLTIPDMAGASDTFVFLSKAQTITGKSIAGSQITGAYTSSAMTMTTARLLGRTTAATGVVEEITVGSGLSLSAGSLTATGGGGTVTNTGGSLTANSLVLGAGTNDTKVVAGIITDGVSQLTLGVNTTTLGKVKLFGNTSGDATMQPAAVAGTATVVTLPNASSTLPIFGQQITFSGPTAARTVTFPDASFTAARTDAANTFTGASSTTSWAETTPVITGGLTASGSGSNTFAGSTGTFITSTGANTLSGAVTINDATTPSLTTSAGKTNTGFVQVNGKTSGAIKLLPVDAAAQTVTVSLAAQTTGAGTATIPDLAGTSDTFVFTTKAQTITGKSIANTQLTGAYTAGGETMSTARLLGRTTAATGAVEEITVGSGLSLTGGSLTATGGGTGTVTNTGGNLTANSVMLGAGVNDSKVVAGIITDGTSKLTLGVAGTSVGSVDFKNATSGTATIAPPTGALGAFTVTLPNAASTLPIFGQQITFSGPTAARTITLPDAAFTVARTDAAQTFTGHNTFEGVTPTGATGTGLMVFGTSPTFITPALGTPASGVVTNLTGTASININGTVGATTPTTGAFTTVKDTGLHTIDFGTGSLPALISSAANIQLGGADNNYNAIEGDTYSASGFAGVYIQGRLAGGTRASPAATPASGALVQLLGYGHDGTTLQTAAKIFYKMEAASLWTSGNNETRHLWQGTPNGSTTSGQWMVLDGSGLTVKPNGTTVGGFNSTGLFVGVNSGTNGAVKLFGSTSGDVTIKAAAAAGTATNFQLPPNNGTSGYSLTTDGSGNTTWTNVSGGAGGSPGGSTTQVQFNDAGSFGGNAGMVFDKTLPLLTLAETSPITRTAPTSSVLQLIGTSGTATTAVIDNEAASGQLIFRRANAAVTTLAANDNMGFVSWAGYDGTAFSSGQARVQGTATETWTGSAHGTQIDFYTTPNLSTSAANIASITGGGFQTSGTLSAAGTTTLGGTDVTGAGTLLVKGATKAVRVTNASTGTSIEGTDNTGTGSFQPLTLGGSSLTMNVTARTSGVASYFTVNTPADTGITAATEAIGNNHVTATRTWATTGTVALQREHFFAGPTYASASASQTFTDAFTVYITKPVAGTNAIFTRAHSLGIVDSTSAASSITGGLVVATTVGTTATSVGIGGGNVNAGGLITGGTVTSTGTLTASAALSVGTTLTATGGASSLANTTVAGAAATTALTITQTARTSGVLPYFKLTIPTDTGQTAATESPGFQTVTGTRTWATTGTVATQREFLFVAPTYASASASQTFTNAATVAISAAPIAGTNAVITNPWSLWVQGGNSLFAGSILSGSANAKIGFQTGTSAGGAVTQATSRTTGVTLNTSTGAITLVSAAGLATYQTFTVTDSTVAATDVVSVCQKSGTDLYITHVTAVAAGSFNISFATTGGVTVEQPVFNFVVIKGSAN